MASGTRRRVARGRPLQKVQRIPYDYSERLRYLFRRDSGTCQICGEPVDWGLRNRLLHPGKPTIDHRQAKSKGGARYAVSNQQLAHFLCNQRKSTKTMRQVRAAQPQLRTLRSGRGRPTPVRRSLRTTPSLAELLRG